MIFIKHRNLHSLRFTMDTKFNNHILTILFFTTLFALTTSVQSRYITTVTTTSTDLISDGLDNNNFLRLPVLQLKNSNSSTDETCEQTYGFLPCTTTILGNLFLIIVYGFLMFTAAKYLSNGSELLLEILGPGLIGGLLLPTLGALPDALLILVSGLSGTKETAQSQVLVGIGLLAGSTVMLLTVLWGSCVVVGKTDLKDSTQIDLQDIKKFSLTGSGVSVDIWTSYAARIMTLSIVPFVIVQLSQVFHTSSGKRLVILISLIAAVVLLLSYCAYQVFQPWIQTRKLEYVKHKHVMSGILRHLKKHALGRLLTDDGEPNEPVIRQLFKAIDMNGDGCLSHGDLRALIIGIHFDEIDLDQEEAAQKLMSDFDTTGDGLVNKDEFFVGISNWLKEAKRATRHTGDPSPHTSKCIDHFDNEVKQEHELLGNHSDEVMEGAENPKWVIVKAVSLLLLGTAIAAAFADPLVDAVNNFSSATSIPSFFISFIALPLATNSSEAVTAIIFASKKKKRTSSLTYSEIYGAVTMNNLLCLAVFLALVYARDLTWNFSAEVLVILIVCVVMGLVCSLRTVFPLWMSFIAYLLYPFSLALVYVLDYQFGWS